MSPTTVTEFCTTPSESSKLSSGTRPEVATGAHSQDTQHEELPWHSPRYECHGKVRPQDVKLTEVRKADYSPIAEADRIKRLRYSRISQRRTASRRMTGRFCCRKESTSWHRKSDGANVVQSRKCKSKAARILSNLVHENVSQLLQARFTLPRTQQNESPSRLTRATGTGTGRPTDTEVVYLRRLPRAESP